MESLIAETLVMERPSDDRREGGVVGSAFVDAAEGKKGSDQKVSRVDDNGSGMRLNGEVVDGKFGVNGEVVSEVGKVRAINLVVDLSRCSLKESGFNIVEESNAKKSDVEFAVKESRRLDGGDGFSGLDSFVPAKTVDFVRDLATNPLGVNRFDVSTVGGQLSEFNRWKGYHQLQLNQVLDELDDKSDVNSELHSEGKPKARGRGRPRKKVKCLTDLMSNGKGSASEVEFKPKTRGRKRKVIQANGSGEGSQSQTQSAVGFLSQIYLTAINPTEGQPNLDSLLKFSSDFKNFRLTKNKNDEEIANQQETTETDGFTGVKDSYSADMTTVTKSDSSQKPDEENSATSLTFKFTSLDSVPSVKELHEIYGRFGTLQETETLVLKKKKCVRLVFERKCDAEAAFSSCGKFAIFGAALLSYRINFFPKLRKTDAAGKKAVKSAKKKLQFGK